MFKKIMLLAAALVVLSGLFTSQNANATLLFQSVPDLTVRPQENGYCSACFNFRWQVFDQFSLDSRSDITTMQIAINGRITFPTAPYVQVWSIAPGNMPGTLLWQERFTWKCLVPGCAAWPIYTYTIDNWDVAILTLHPDGLELPHGNYYLSFYEGDYVTDELAVPSFKGGSGLMFQWLGKIQGDADGCACIFHTGESLGFKLEGDAIQAVPEPPSGALFGTALLLAIIAFGLRRGIDRAFL